MRLSELKKIALLQGFEFERVSRVHSSLYRLSNSIPETGSPAYFDSMYSLLAFITMPDHRKHIEFVSVTKQWSFGQLRNFDVINVWIKPEFKMELIDQQIRSRRADFNFWMINGTDLESYDGNDDAVINGFHDLGDLHEYGLELVFIPANAENNGYFRYLLSTGDPHEEIRFFSCGRIEFVSMPWFKFYSRDISADHVFEWLRNYLSDLGCLNFDEHIDDLYHDDLDDLE